jgi:hypothetical protein
MLAHLICHLVGAIKIKKKSNEFIKTIKYNAALQIIINFNDALQILN